MLRIHTSLVGREEAQKTPKKVPTKEKDKDKEKDKQESRFIDEIGYASKAELTELFELLKNVKGHCKNRQGRRFL